MLQLTEIALTPSSVRKMAAITGIGVALLSLAASCSQSARLTNTQLRATMKRHVTSVRYSLEGGSLSLSLPENWVVYEANRDIVFLAGSPIPYEPFEPQIIIMKDDLHHSTDLEGYLVSNNVLLSSTMDSFVDNGSGVYHSRGQQMAWQHYSFTQDDMRISAIDFYVMDGDTGYVVNCKSPSDMFEEVKDLFERVGRSLSASPTPGESV